MYLRRYFKVYLIKKNILYIFIRFSWFTENGTNLTYAINIMHASCIAYINIMFITGKVKMKGLDEIMMIVKQTIVII
jgi:hypothetical protein